MRFYKDYGIHGTNNLASIGKAVSDGCIHMHNTDVNYVYSLAPIGTEVNVVSSQTTDRYYVVQPGNTLYGISQKLGVSYDALLRENRVTDPNMIYVDKSYSFPDKTIKAVGYIYLNITHCFYQENITNHDINQSFTIIPCNTTAHNFMLP